MASGGYLNEDTLSPRIPPALESFAPKSLRTAGAITGNEKFKQLYNLVYNTVQVRQVQGGGQHLEIMFCSLTPQQLEPFRGCMPELGTVEANPIGFYHVLHMLSHATVQNTRPFRREVVALMANDPVNALLRANLAQPGDNAQEEDYLMNLFLRLVNTMQSAIAVLHQKARLGVEAYCWNKQLTKQLNNLEILAQDMQYTLVSRADTNNAAHKLVRCREKTLETLVEYVALENPIPPTNTVFLQQDFNLHGEFKFDGEFGLNTLVEDRTLWFNYIFVPDLDTNLIPEFITVKDTLKEIIKEIKSFVPNSMDAAADVAKNVKPVIISTCEEYEQFKDSNTKTIGIAQSLMKDVDNHRSTIQKLQSEGLIINEATVGTTQQNLATIYAYLSDFVLEENKESRLKEAKAKIELQELSKASNNVKLTITPLNGIHSWLSFYKSYQEIIKLHTSDLVKAQVVRNSLTDKTDIKFCQNLNHDEIMQFLKLKYEDPGLIPDMITQVTKLPRASSYSIAHDNICTFRQMYMHLVTFYAEHRLDAATRDKLVPILFVEKLQIDFFRSKREKEREWKAEFSPDSPSVEDDSLSIISASDEKLEELRRKHFVNEVEECLPIMRQLMKNTASTSAPDKGSNSNFHDKSRGSKTHARMGNFHDDSASDNSKSDSDEDLDHDCPICYTVHYSKEGTALKALSRCPRFKYMDIKTKNKVVKRTKYCPRCLRFKDPESHQDGDCSWASSRNLICYRHDTPSNTHHPILCTDYRSTQQRSKDEENKAEDE